MTNITQTESNPTVMIVAESPEEKTQKVLKFLRDNPNAIVLYETSQSATLEIHPEPIKHRVTQ